MEKKAVMIDSPVVVAGLTLMPVVEVSLNCWQRNSDSLFFGVKQPIVIIVSSSSMRRAFRITGEEISLDQLVQEVPAVEETLGD